MTLVSIVVPTYRRPGPLRRCLATLASQDAPREAFEVVVVDDGSDPPVDPGLVGALRDRLDIRLLRIPHAGPAAARARGAAVARGDLLAFLDDDCTVPEGYVAAVRSAFAACPDMMVAQPRLDNPEPDNPYGRAWAFALRTALRASTAPGPGGRTLSRLLGGTAVLRREVLGRAGFDAGFRYPREDADPRLQLERLGIAVYYEPAIVVRHHCRTSLRAYLAQHFGYGRGEVDLQRKWGPAPPGPPALALTSVGTLRALVAEEGMRRGLATWALFWLRSRAGLCGLLYERDVRAHPGGHPASRVLRATRTWLAWEARHLAGVVRASRHGRGPAATDRRPAGRA